MPRRYIHNIKELFFILFTSSIFISVSLAASQCDSRDEILVQSESKFPASNGCSKPAGISVGGEEDFTYCCDRHDVCYSICGISKDFCEKDFGRCMTNLCKTRFRHNPQCSSAASMYQMGTTMFGGNGFQDLQDEFCTCTTMSNTEVSQHYLKLYRQIYEKHSDKSKEEYSDLLDNIEKKIKPTNEKKKDVRKFGALLYKLIKKYDTAIIHEGGRIGKNPPKPVSGDEL